MIERRSQQQSVVATAIRALVVFDAASLLLMAALHVGARIPLVFVTLADVPIRAAAIVEGLAGLGFLIVVFAVFTHQDWAWPAAVAAHAFALLGVLMGIGFIAAGFGPHSVLNDTYHRLMVVLLGVGLVLLFTPSGKEAFGRRDLGAPW